MTEEKQNSINDTIPNCPVCNSNDSANHLWDNEYSCHKCKNIYWVKKSDNPSAPEQTLKEIGEELGIKWTDLFEDIKKIIDNDIDWALYKEQREKDL